MKKTFTIQLDTQVTIDFTSWGLSDAEQRGGDATKQMILNHFLEECGIEEFEVKEKNGSTLFEAIAEVVKAENETLLMLNYEVEYTIEKKLQ